MNTYSNEKEWLPYIKKAVLKPLLIRKKCEISHSSFFKFG